MANPIDPTKNDHGIAFDRDAGQFLHGKVVPRHVGHGKAHQRAREDDQHGHEHRPAEPHDRLLVTHADVAAGELVRESAVGPEFVDEDLPQVATDRRLSRGIQPWEDPILSGEIASARPERESDGADVGTLNGSDVIDGHTDELVFEHANKGSKHTAVFGRKSARGRCQPAVSLQASPAGSQA